jgi:hypothetical protein
MHGLAAHSQIIVIGGMCCVLYAGWYVAVGAGTWGDRLRFGAGIAAACVLGAVGSLPQMLPMMEVGSWTVYTDADFGYYKSGSFELKYIIGLAGPWMVGDHFGEPQAGMFIGTPDSGCFIGLLPLALAVLGFGAAWRRLRGTLPEVARRPASPNQPELWRVPLPSRVETGFWLTLFAFNALLMLGHLSPLYRLFFSLPVYKMFHCSSRHLWVVGLTLSWFAALGFEGLRQTDPARWRRPVLTVTLFFTLLGAVSAVAILTWTAWSPKPALTYPGFWIPIVCGLAVLIVLALAIRTPQRSGWLIALVALAFVELRLTLGDYFFSPMPAERAWSPAHFPKFVDWLRQHGEGAVPARAIMEVGCWRSEVPRGQAPNCWGQMWGISVYNCYSQSMPRSLAELLRLDHYGNTHLARVLFEERGLSALGGRFIVMTDKLPMQTPELGYCEANANTMWGPLPPRLTCTEGKTTSIAGRVFLAPEQPFLLHGELSADGPVRGQIHVRATDDFWGTVLGEWTITATDFHNGRATLAQFLGRLVRRDPRSTVNIALTAKGEVDVQITSLEWWALQSQPVSGSPAEAIYLAQHLRDNIHQPYFLAADTYPRIYVNPRARTLATLVQEIRPAEDDLTAARAQLECHDRPVTEIAFVTASLAQSYGLQLCGPRTFSLGTAKVESYRGEDFSVRTNTAGDGFLVLAVTRCRGWSATVDGQPAPIHAVDGPLMGVQVPAGEHLVRLQFEPVLWRQGAIIALTAFALAGLAVALSAWRSHRRANIVA